MTQTVAKPPITVGSVVAATIVGTVTHRDGNALIVYIPQDGTTVRVLTSAITAVQTEPTR